MGGRFKAARKLSVPIPIHYVHNWDLNPRGLGVPALVEKRSVVGEISISSFAGNGRSLILNLRHHGLTAFKTRDIQFKIMKLLEEEGYDFKRTQQQLTKRKYV